MSYCACLFLHFYYVNFKFAVLICGCFTWLFIVNDALITFTIINCQTAHFVFTFLVFLGTQKNLFDWAFVKSFLFCAALFIPQGIMLSATVYVCVCAVCVCFISISSTQSHSGTYTSPMYFHYSFKCIVVGGGALWSVMMRVPSVPEHPMSYSLNRQHVFTVKNNQHVDEFLILILLSQRNF